MSNAIDKQEPTFTYTHKRASKLCHQLSLSPSFQQELIYERIRNAVVIYLDTPLEDQYSENFMIQPSVMRWVESMIPDHHENFEFSNLRGVFKFRHKHHAMMFKLTYADGFTKAG